MFTPHHVSHVRCHVSCVTCQVSHVRCHVSQNIFSSSFFDKMMASRWRVCYQRGLPLLVFNMSCVGVFQSVRDILQSTVFLDHPVGIAQDRSWYQKGPIEITSFWQSVVSTLAFFPSCVLSSKTLKLNSAQISLCLRSLSAILLHYTSYIKHTTFKRCPDMEYHVQKVYNNTFIS